METFLKAGGKQKREDSYECWEKASRDVKLLEGSLTRV